MKKEGGGSWVRGVEGGRRKKWGEIGQGRREEWSAKDIFGDVFAIDEFRANDFASRQTFTSFFLF